MAPMTVGVILDNMDDQWKTWSTIFLMSGSLTIFANILFLFFASAERQDFDYLKGEKKDQSLTNKQIRKIIITQMSRKRSIS